MKIDIESIGTIFTEFKDRENMPVQPCGGDKSIFQILILLRGKLKVISQPRSTTLIQTHTTTPPRQQNYSRSMPVTLTLLQAT